MVFGKTNEMNQQLLKAVTISEEDKFLDVRQTSKSFPDLEQIEHYRDSLLSKDRIMKLVNSIIQNMGLWKIQT